MNYRIVNSSNCELMVNIGGQDIILSPQIPEVVQKNVLDKFKAIYPSFISVIEEVEEPATTLAGEPKVEEEEPKKERKARSPKVKAEPVEDFDSDEDIKETMVAAPKKTRGKRS